MCDSYQMDMRLRQLLLTILDDLSDLDRCRLHFVLGKHIPRRLREITNVEHTIQVFEYLIDGGNIFNCLIEALSACGKSNWSDKLKEFEQTPLMPILSNAQQSQPNNTLTQLVLTGITDEEEYFSMS